VLRPLRHLAAGVEGRALHQVTDAKMVGAVREWLAENLLFEPPKAEFQLSEGHVMHLGHGTLMGCLGGKNFLVDPWIPRAPAGPGPIPLPRFALPRLDAVFLTALDVDLADVETLMLLPEDVPLFVPSQPAVVLLRSLGFTDVREVEAGAQAQIGALQVRAVAVAEGAAVGWMLHDGEQGMLALGRNSEPVLDFDAQRVSPVFASRVASSAPRLMLGWPVLLEPFARWFEPAVRPGALQPIVDRLQPAEIALYCEGGARWYPRRTPAIRKTGDPNRGPLTRLLPTPAELAASLGTAVRAATPYDVYRVGGSFERSVVAAFTRKA
jgi:hypothetical protein